MVQKKYFLQLFLFFVLGLNSGVGQNLIPLGNNNKVIIKNNLNSLIQGMMGYVKPDSLVTGGDKFELKDIFVDIQRVKYYKTINTIVYLKAEEVISKLSQKLNYEDWVANLNNIRYNRNTSLYHVLHSVNDMYLICVAKKKGENIGEFKVEGVFINATSTQTPALKEFQLYASSSYVGVVFEQSFVETLYFRIKKVVELGNFGYALELIKDIKDRSDFWNLTPPKRIRYINKWKRICNRNIDSLCSKEGQVRKYVERDAKEINKLTKENDSLKRVVKQMTKLLPSCLENVDSLELENRAKEIKVKVERMVNDAIAYALTLRNKENISDRRLRAYQDSLSNLVFYEFNRSGPNAKPTNIKSFWMEKIFGENVENLDKKLFKITSFKLFCLNDNIPFNSGGQYLYRGCIIAKLEEDVFNVLCECKKGNCSTDTLKRDDKIDTSIYRFFMYDVKFEMKTK